MILKQNYGIFLVFSTYATWQNTTHFFKSFSLQPNEWEGRRATEASRPSPKEQGWDGGDNKINGKQSKEYRIDVRPRKPDGQCLW